MSSNYENLNVPQTMSVRVQIAELVFVANARALPARRVPLTAALKVADRVLARSSYTDLTARAFAVERAVTKFITLATLGARTGESVEHLDLLPVAHPLSTAPSALTASALSEARAEWLAADLRISDELRPLVASAYTLEFGSIERTHALARLEAAGAEVPLDLIALVADGNSSAARSARARRQLRDRLKRFAFEGGMGGFLVRMGEKVKNKVGALVGGSSTTGIGEVYITEDDDELGLKKGDILPVKLDNYEGLDVMLTDEQLKKAGVKLSSSKVSSSKRAQDIQELLANKLEAPSDWKKLPNGDFVTEDGFIATPKGNLQYELKDENGNVVPGLEAAEWPDIQKHIKKAAEDEFGTEDGPAADAEPEKTYVKKDLKVEQLYIGDLLPQYYPIKGAEESLLKKRKEDPNYELPPTDEIIGVYKAKAPNKRGIKVRNLETGKERYFEVNKTARIYDVRQKQAESKPETAPTTPALNFGPMMEVDLTPEEILDGKDDKGFESNWIEANGGPMVAPSLNASNAKKASKKRILEKALGRALTQDEMNALNLNPEKPSFTGGDKKDTTFFLPDQEYLNKKEKTLLDMKAELNLKNLKPKLDVSDMNKYAGTDAAPKKPEAKAAPKNPPSKKQKEMIRSMLLERVMTGEQRQAYMDRLGAAESKDINGLFNELKALPKAKVPLTDGSDPLNQHENPELAKIKQRLAPFDLDGSIRRYIDEKTANGGEVSAKEIRDLLKDNKDFDPTKSYVDYANESQFLNSGLGVYKTESEKKAAEESSAKFKENKAAVKAKIDALKEAQAGLAPLSKEEHQAKLEELVALIGDENDPDGTTRRGILNGTIRTSTNIMDALLIPDPKNMWKYQPTPFASDWKNLSADESKNPESWALINMVHALPDAPEGFEPQFIANSLKAYDNENGDLSKLISSGASYQEVLDWLDTNSQLWRTRKEDYDTRGFVDMPFPYQKTSWKKFGDLLSRMSNVLGEGEGSKEEKPNTEFISALSERLPENAIKSLDEELPKAFSGDSLSDLLGKIETEEDLERVVDELTIARASDAVTPEQEALLKKVQDAVIQKFYEDNPDLENTMSEPTDVIPAPIEAETPSLTISELYEATGDLQDMEGGYPESLFEQVDEIQAGALKIDALNEEVLDLLGDGDREGAAAKLAELADAYDDFAKQVELARELGADAFDDPDFKKKDQDKVIANYKSAAKQARELAAAAKVEEKPSGPELESAEQTDGNSANQTSTPNWSFDFDLSDLDYLADELGLPEKEDGYTEHEFLDAWLKKNGLDKKGVKYAPVGYGSTVTDVQFEIPDSAKNAFAKAYIGPDSKTFWADVADGSYGQPVEATGTEAKPNWKFDFDLSDPDYLADMFGFPEKEDGYTANEVVDEWLKKNGLDKAGVKYVPVDENATVSDVLFEIPDSAKDAFAEAYLPNEKEMFWADVADGSYGQPVGDADADADASSDGDFEWPAEPNSMSMQSDIKQYATDKPNWKFGFSELGDDKLQGLIKWLDENKLTEKGVRFKSIKDAGNYDDVELYIPDSAKNDFAQAFAGEDGDSFWADVADGNYGTPIDAAPATPEVPASKATPVAVGVKASEIKVGDMVQDGKKKKIVSDVQVNPKNGNVSIELKNLNGTPWYGLTDLKPDEIVERFEVPGDKAPEATATSGKPENKTDKPEYTAEFTGLREPEFMAEEVGLPAQKADEEDWTEEELMDAWLKFYGLDKLGVKYGKITPSYNGHDVELEIPDAAKDAFAKAYANEDSWDGVDDMVTPIGEGAPEAPSTGGSKWSFGFADENGTGAEKWLEESGLKDKGVTLDKVVDNDGQIDIEVTIPDSAKDAFAEAYAGQDGESFWKDVADGDHGQLIDAAPEEPEVVPADSETSKDDGNFEWPAEPKSMSMKSDIEKYATENPNWSFDFAELGDKPLQGLIEWLDANKLTEKGVRFKSIADNGNNHSVELYIPDSAKAAFAEAFSGDENFWNDVADGDYGSPIEGVPSPFSTDNSDKLLAEAESNRKEIEDLDFALSTAIDSLGVEYTPMLFGITGNEHIVKNILDDLDASDGANSIALSSSLYELHQALENAGIAPLVTEHVRELADAMDAFTPAEGGDKNDLVTVDTIKQEQDGVLDLSSWKKVGGQKGSNPGGTYENPETGEQVYVKTPKSQLHGENERLASALYDAAGISSAKVLKGKLADGTEVTYSPMIDGAKQDLKKNLKNKEYMARLQEGYALDALLANWDVIGLDFDNVVTDKNGEPVRVDPGGALLFRAQGSPKGGSFGEDVPELDAFTDKTSSRPSAKVFSQMTDEQKLSSAEVLQNLTPSKIDELVNSIITDPEKREELKTKLKARREFILNKFGLGADSEQKKEKNPAPGSSGNTKTLDVTGGIESLQAQLDEAAKNGDLVAFKYNGKDRVVAPKYVWTNPKNGNVNLTGDEGDVSNKNYTLQNFEASSSTSADGDEEEIEEKLAEEKPKSTSSVFGEMKQDLADENFRAAATELIQAKLPAGYTATAEKGILDTGFVLVKNSQGETVAMVTMDPSDPTKFAVQNFKAGWKIETFKMLSQAIDKVVDAVKVVQEPGQVVQLSDGSTGKKGSKVVHSKNGITGTIVGFQKDPNYVKVKPDNGDPIKIMSINQIKSNGSGGEAVSAPEAPNAPEAPSAPEPEAKLNASQIVPQVSENMTLFAGPDGMPVKTIVIKTYEGKWDVIYDYNGPDFKPLHTDIESREEAEDLAIEEIVNPTAAPVGVPTVASQGENYTFYKGPDGKNSQIIANKTFDGKWEVVFDLGGPLEEKLHENLDSREDAEEKAVKAIQADWDSINNPEAATKPAKAAPTGPKKFTFDFMSLSDVTDAPEVKDSGDSLDGDNEKIKADSAGTLIKPGAIVKDENGRVGVYRVLSYGNSDKIRMIWEDGTQDSVFPNTVTATGKYIEPGIAGVYAGLADLDFDKKSEPLPADYIANGLADKNGKNLGYMQLVVDKNGDTGVLVEQKGKDGYVKVAFPDGMKTRKADTLEGLDSRYTKQEYHLKIAQKHYKQLVTYNNDKYNLPTFGTTVKSSKSAGTPGVIAVPKNAAGATAQEVKTLDWNESDFEGVPSLEALLAQVTDTSVADSGLRGGSIALNSGSVEDLDLRIMAASGTSGEDAYLLKYKLTSWAGDDLANKLVEMIKNNDPTVTVSSGLFVPENTIDGDKVSFTPSAYSDKAKYKSPYGETFIVTLEDGTKIYFLRADQPTKHKGGASKVSGDAPRAYHNKVMVIAPRTSTPAQLGFALQTAGVQDVRPSTQADAKILIENRLMSIFDEKVDPKSNLSGKQREESLQRIKDTWGIGPENVTIKPGAGGRVEMRLDEESAKKIANKTKIKVLRHNLTGGSANKNSSYNETLEEKQERIANYFVSRVASPHGGLLSTTTRWSEGVPTGGMSSQADIKTGGADYVFTTPVHGVISKNDSLVPLIYFSAERAFQRLDFWANQSDQFGKRTGKSPIDQAVPGGYEVMFKGRLSFDDAEVLMVSDQTLRTLIITKLRQKGITEIGGRPLEAVIMTGEDYQALQTQATA